VRAFLAALLLLALNANGQEPPFPQRGPLEITVLFPAGSSADVTARLLAERFDEASIWCMTTERQEYAGGQASDPPAPGSEPPAWYS